MDGEWQVTLTSPAELPPGKPLLYVQKFKDNKWRNEPLVRRKKQWVPQPIKPEAGKTVVWRGTAIDPSFTEIRLVWKGREMSVGSMRI